MPETVLEYQDAIAGSDDVLHQMGASQEVKEREAVDQMRAAISENFREKKRKSNQPSILEGSPITVESEKTLGILKQLAGRFREDPRLLLGLPELRTLSKDPYTRPRQFSDEFITWSEQMGLAAEDIFDRKMWFSDLTKNFALSERLVEVFDHDYGKLGTIDLVYLLESLKIVTSERAFLDGVLNSAKELLGKYLPQMMVAEPTRFLAGYHYSDSAEEEDSVSGGTYLGRFANKHFIKLSIQGSPNSTFNDSPRVTAGDQISELSERDRQIAILVGVHELVHQKVEEYMAAKGFPESQIDSSVRRSAEKGPETSKFWFWAENWQREHGSNDNLGQAINEGLATVVQLYVADRYRSDLSAQGEAEKAEYIRDQKKDRVANLQRGKSASGDSHDRYQKGHHYFAGVRVIAKLVEQFGMENLPKVLQALDIQKIRAIKMNTPEYNQVLADPMLLPGLENFDQTH